MPDEPVRSDGTPHAAEEKLKIFQCTNDMTQLRFFESLIVVLPYRGKNLKL